MVGLPAPAGGLPEAVNMTTCVCISTVVAPLAAGESSEPWSPAMKFTYPEPTYGPGGTRGKGMTGLVEPWIAVIRRCVALFGITWSGSGGGGLAPTTWEK